MDAGAVMIQNVGGHLTGLLEAVTPAGLSALDSNDSLKLLSMLDQYREVIDALSATTLHHADLTNTSKVPVDEVLHATNWVTRSGAKSRVRLARDLAGHFGPVHEAWRAGDLSGDQVKAIIRGMKDLPMKLSPDLWGQVQSELIELAQHHDPAELKLLAARYYQVLLPAEAEQREARLAALDARAAFQARSLTLEPDHHGSYLITGSIPQVLGEQLAAQLEAAMPSAESYRQAGMHVPSRAARRADALEILVGLIDTSPDAPRRNGDRPTMYVAVKAKDLTSQQGVSRSLETGEPIGPAETRTMACDVNLARLVLGEHGEILELGRSQRLFKGPLRRALTIRDQGCVFPGCDVIAAACDGHHIIPWQQGGKTELGNAVLLCKFHHRLVEPDPNQSQPLQWQIAIDPDTGWPTFTPPVTMLGGNEPRTHHRYKLRARTPLTA